jgi:hypothetical protein
MGELGELDAREQQAMFWLCARLLRMDWPVRLENRERLTLLWLEWRDRGGGADSDLPGSQLERAVADIERGPAGKEGDPRTRRAVDVLQASGRGLAVIRFLFDLARENGINRDEDAFLRELREHLERVGISLGAYR